MADALGEVLANEYLAARLGAAAKLSVEPKFEAGRVVSRFEALYLAGLASKRRRPLGKARVDKREVPPARTPEPKVLQCAGVAGYLWPSLIDYSC